jgi:hypothetical protein
VSSCVGNGPHGCSFQTVGSIIRRSKTSSMLLSASLLKRPFLGWSYEVKSEAAVDTVLCRALCCKRPTETSTPLVDQAQRLPTYALIICSSDNLGNSKHPLPKYLGGILTLLDRTTRRGAILTALPVSVTAGGSGRRLSYLRIRYATVQRIEMIVEWRADCWKHLAIQVINDMRYVIMRLAWEKPWPACVALGVATVNNALRILHPGDHSIRLHNMTPHTGYLGASS